MTENEKEQAHLDMCLEIIRANIHQYEQEYQKRHALSQELYKAINSGDVELYNQLMTTVSLEEQAAQSLRKNNVAALKPYFGRIDYTDRQLEKQEQIYIGKNGIIRETPFANLYVLEC